MPFCTDLDGVERWLDGEWSGDRNGELMVANNRCRDGGEVYNIPPMSSKGGVICACYASNRGDGRRLDGMARCVDVKCINQSGGPAIVSLLAISLVKMSNL